MPVRFLTGNDRPAPVEAATPQKVHARTVIYQVGGDSIRVLENIEHILGIMQQPRAKPVMLTRLLDRGIAKIVVIPPQLILRIEEA